MRLRTALFAALAAALSFVSATAQNLSPGTGQPNSPGLQSFTPGPGLSCTTTAGAVACSIDPEVVGSSDFTVFNPTWANTNSTTNTEAIQAWLDALYVQYTNAQTAQSLQNLTRVACIVAVIPQGKLIDVDSPLIVHEGICTDFRSLMRRKGSAGTITSNYTGDPSTQADANLYQPAMIFVPGSHNVGRVEFILNSNGSDGGSGFAIGRTWSVQTLALGAGGTGYTNGDTCTTVNGDSKLPYTGAQFVIAASGGVVTGVTYTGVRWDGTGHSGVYPMPLLMQQTVWTAGNGWTGSRAVFDGSGNYLITCASGGSGASVSAVMWPDWCDGTNGCSASVTYHGWFSNYSPIFAYYGILKATQSRNTTSATYGGTFGVLDSAYDHRADEFYSNLANQGIIVTGTDLFINRINSTSDGTGLTLSSGGNINCPDVVLDNDSGTYLEIDGETQDNLSGSTFTDTATTPTVSTQAIGIGANSSSTTKENSDLNLKFTAYNAATAAGAPYLKLAYVRSSDIRVVVSNVGQNGLVYASQSNPLVAFGTDVQPSTFVSGLISNVPGALYSGTFPTNMGWNVWDSAAPVTPGTTTATIGGTLTIGDQLQLTVTNAKLAGLPETVSYTTLGGDTTTTMATALAAAINADSVLSALTPAITATSSGAVVTVSELGTWTVNTVITQTVTGSATETITLSNSGVPTGETNGAITDGPGFYHFWNSSSPSQKAGIGKAGGGSTWFDSFNGVMYVNSGTAAAPNWVQASVFSTAQDTTPGESIAIGPASQTGISSPAAYKNISIGRNTLAGAMTTGAVQNTAIGDSVLQHVTSGTNNACFGTQACQAITNGGYNIGFGPFSLVNMLGGNDNIGIGLNAGATFTSGNYNTCIGYKPCDTVALSGSNNIVLSNINGTKTVDVPSATSNYNLNIGNVIAGTMAGNANPHMCAVGVKCVLGVLYGANFNSTADQTIQMAPLAAGVDGYLPAATKYVVTDVYVTNCSTALTLAAGGVYNGTGKPAGIGVFVAAGQTYTNCTSATSMQVATMNTTATQANTYNQGLVYLSLTTAQGGAATGDVYILGYPIN